MKPVITCLRQLDHMLTVLIQVLSVLTAFVMLSSLILGVFYRYVLNDALTWTEEVAMLCFSWSIFLTAALMVRENGHVRVELIEAMLPARLRWLLNKLIWVLIALVGAYMAWTGYQFIFLTMGQSSPAIRYPVWIRDISFSVGGVLIAFYALVQLGGNFCADTAAPSTTPAEPSL
jgi:TRAP-type C4-dicarboxylate transport system permease small subunit